MKDKMNEVVVKIGSSTVDHRNISAIEAVSVSAVAILAVMAGTMLGDKLF